MSTNIEMGSLGSDRKHLRVAPEDEQNQPARRNRTESLDADAWPSCPVPARIQSPRYARHIAAWTSTSVSLGFRLRALST